MPLSCPKCTKSVTALPTPVSACKHCGYKPAAAAPAAAAPDVQQPPGWNSVEYNIGEQPAIREEFATALGLADKSHKQHGSNFDSPQTKRQIMDNLLEPFGRNLPANQVAALRQKCVSTYGYNPKI